MRIETSLEGSATYNEADVTGWFRPVSENRTLDGGTIADELDDQDG